MTLTTFMQQVSYAFRALEDDAPGLGTPDWIYWTSILNLKKDELYRDVSKQFPETYQVLNLGTITASAAPSFDLDDNFLSASDTAYVIDTAGTRYEFDIIKAQERDPNKQQVFISGLDPKTLYFTKAIAANAGYVGGTLFLPAYIMPDDVSATNGSATIPLPNPYWGVYAVAGEVAANDLSYEDKAPDLNAKANNLFNMMVKQNIRGTFANPRKSRTNVIKIGQRHSRR
jgi:hypothetical protein